MFKKVLVVEDIDSINLGVVSVLEKMGEVDIHCTKYCDEAMLKIKRGKIDAAPFDLLITDLSFKEDHRAIAIKSGEELIEAIKKEQPEIQVIAYSVEDRPLKIKALFDKFHINGYVSKGRNSIVELKKAIEEIYKTNRYVPEYIANALKEDTVFEIETYDTDLLNHLSRGLSQEEISIDFKKRGYSSSSVSSIEKRINRLKIYFNAKNIAHLITITKDLGLI